MIYTAPFDARTLGTITLATNGETDVVVNLAALTGTDTDSASSTLFWHSLSPTNFAYVSVQTGAALGYFRKVSVAPWYAAVEAAIEAAMTTATWTTPSAFELTWNASNPHVTIPSYTFAWPVANFSITFSNAATSAIFGFTGNVSGAQTYTGSASPTYVLVPSLDGGSDPTPYYEPDSVANHVSSDQGQGHGMSRTVSPIHQDWRQEFESKEKTFKGNASATHPWTFQHLFEYCRGTRPFSVYTPRFDFEVDYVPAYYLRSDGANFKPERHSPGNASQFWIPFRCEVGGFFEVAS